MMENKIKIILDDITKYEHYNFNETVKERLNKTLELYLQELERSYVRLKCKDTDFMVKELSRQQ